MTSALQNSRHEEENHIKMLPVVIPKRLFPFSLLHIKMFVSFLLTTLCENVFLSKTFTESGFSVK